MPNNKIPDVAEAAKLAEQAPQAKKRKLTPVVDQLVEDVKQLTKLVTNQANTIVQLTEKIVQLEQEKAKNKKKEWHSFGWQRSPDECACEEHPCQLACLVEK
jgi:hypothetical protein